MILQYVTLLKHPDDTYNIMVLLKYGRYMDKPKHPVRGIFMQVAVINWGEHERAPF